MHCDVNEMRARGVRRLRSIRHLQRRRSMRRTYLSIAKHELKAYTLKNWTVQSLLLRDVVAYHSSVCLMLHYLVTGA